MKYLLLVFMLLLYANIMNAQEKLQVKFNDAATNQPLELVIITVDGKGAGATDNNGISTIPLTIGTHELSFSLTGYNKIDTTIKIPLADTLRINLTQAATSLEEVTVVASTRTNQAIENSPMKVEVLGLQELNEEAGLKPGNIGSILGDVSGVQVQQSSATLGNSNVRIQGLDGRYTQILRDGMPMYDGFAGSFGILTIPPLDLKQIELIKGSASTLYGGGAIGGLINLISKRPMFQQEADVLVNYTSLKELNANVYVAKRNKKFGYTLFAGYTNQQATDVDKDGFSDVPDANSVNIHPRLFYYPNDKTVVSVSYNGIFDNRKGGDMQVMQDRTDSLHQYFEKNVSQRNTGEYLLEHYFANNVKLTIKGSVSDFNSSDETNLYKVGGRQLSYYNEASVFVPFETSELVVGINVTGSKYNTYEPDTALLKNYGSNTAGAFAQYDIHIKQKTTIEAGLRFNQNDEYGSFLLPRISLFQRFDEHWAARAGFGMGYKTPDPLEQQNIEYNTLELLPLNSTVKPEVSYGYNAEVNYKKDLGGHSSLFINQAFFLTQVNRPVLFDLDSTSGKVNLVNASAPLISKGFDTYVKLNMKKWEYYLGYTFTDARNTYLPSGNFVPITPKDRFAFVVVNDISEKWRAGVEGSYTGTQYRYDYTTTPSYFLLALMVQYSVTKHITLVLNGENLLDYRMSRVESLYTGPVTNPVFKPLWAPIDGRVVNLSLRWKL